MRSRRARALPAPSKGVVPVKARFELMFWPTPNGYKPLILLEELEADYDLRPVDIFRGAQRTASFRAVSPNGRIPALIDRRPEDGGPEAQLFESGELLLYLAECAGRFLSTARRERHEALTWLFWQMGGLGPMMGQAGHFVIHAAEQIPYARTRYVNEVRRLLGVLDARLAAREFIAGAYSVADIACYPWVHIADRVEVSLDRFDHVRRWADRIAARPAVKRAYERGEPIGAGRSVDAEARRHLFSVGEDDGASQ